MQELLEKNVTRIKENGNMNDDDRTYLSLV